MATNQPNSNTQGDDKLRGGTQTDGLAPGTLHPGATPGPGGTNSINPAGGSRPAGRPSEPPDAEKSRQDRQDPQRAFEDGSRKPSRAESTQEAREMADIPPELSQSGYDEGDPKQISPHTPTPLPGREH